MPGLIAEKLDSKILAKLAKKLDRAIIITGTNGKTTTATMLAAVLEGGGIKIVANRSGSNLSRGIISTLVANANLFGRPTAKTGIFEVDEAAMPAVAKALQPEVIIVLNLFRDQLDRYGELDKTAALIGEGIAVCKDSPCKVILNADDPLVASLAKYATGQVAYFGINDSSYQKMSHDHTADSHQCPLCGKHLEFSQNYFSHLGIYACSEGHFDRPKPGIAITKIVSSQAGQYELASTKLNIPLPGLYNAYNALAALSGSQTLDIDTANALAALEKATAAFGRVEVAEFGTAKLKLLLIKNPTGFNQVIDTFLLSDSGVGTQASTLSPKPLNVLVAINDNFADGRDVSWLWDAGLEALLPASQKSQVESQKLGDTQGYRIICSGTRAHDMALRLKYAGLDCEVELDLKTALEKVSHSGSALVLPTYSAMLQIRNLLGLGTKLREVKR